MNLEEREERELWRAVAAHLPGGRVGPVVELGAGLDHRAWEVDGALIVRCATDPDPAHRAVEVEREARLLAVVAGVSPLPVPEVAFTVPELGCLAYRRLPGVPLLNLPLSERLARARPLAATLGGLLAALHGLPGERLDGLVEVDDEPLEGWRDEAAETYRAVRGEVPAAHRPAVEGFLAARPPDRGEVLVFSHSDLGAEHVLVDPATWTVTGVIDWADAARTDPAVDLGLLLRDLGPAALDDPLTGGPIGGPTGGEDPAARTARARFYARCKLLEDLAYGLQTGKNPYTANSLAALAWLFPP